ncbi:hypothetical protein BG000_010620 [Podila horticola]|nr:hypothetical protein BG000_010620 [Podila horticola]
MILEAFSKKSLPTSCSFLDVLISLHRSTPLIAYQLGKVVFMPLSSTSQAAPDEALKVNVDASGAFKRQASSFRDKISDEPGAKFPPEKYNGYVLLPHRLQGRRGVTNHRTNYVAKKNNFRGRYHLYVSYGCPWAHRTLLVRALKGLEDVISLDSTHWFLDERGWQFKDQYKDSLYGVPYLKELYLKADPKYEGRVTVPVLWDKKTEAIVNNESAEIIRMMNAFDRFIPNRAGINFYPKHLQTDIDSVNEWIHETVNNGVYKAGFATSQTAYEDAVYPLFESLDRIEGMLSKSDYLVGNTLTEADLRLWTTIIRFDPVYHTHFKCNIKGIEKDYPNILKLARRIYQMPKVAATVKILYIKKGYFCSQVQVNPTGIYAAGNGPNLAEPKV